MQHSIFALVPVLYTADLPGTIQFYTEALGFSCPEYDPNGWARLECGTMRLVFTLSNARFPFQGPAFTGSLYCYTHEVDTWWEKVKDRAKVCYPPEDFDYGMREFGIYDNNGYLLQFGQELK